MVKGMYQHINTSTPAFYAGHVRIFGNIDFICSTLWPCCGAQNICTS